MLLKSVLVFFAVVVSDFLWMMYLASFEKRQAPRTATFSALIVFIGWALVKLYQYDGRTVVPAVLGAYIGTYLTMKWLEKRHRHK